MKWAGSNDSARLANFSELGKTRLGTHFLGSVQLYFSFFSYGSDLSRLPMGSLTRTPLLVIIEIREYYTGDSIYTDSLNK
jgi:hypothetical protein